jgi:hypothetical protein
MRRVKPAGFVVVSVLWLGAASALGQIMDDTHAAPDMRFVLGQSMDRAGAVELPEKLALGAVS